MQLVAMVLKMFILQVILKLLSSKLSTEDTLTFQKECIAQTFSGSSIPSSESSVTCTLARNGDLVQEIYLQKSYIT